MNPIIDFIHRPFEPQPWSEGEKIPWNDPVFSERMLAVHLDQQNDWASRRMPTIDKHVDWIVNHFLLPHSSILDLGCGPGLYAKRLAQKGHRVVGIDFSPASIAYAKRTATQEKLSIDYQLADIRDADFQLGFDLVMMVFGEFNVFRPESAFSILKKAFRALKSGGHILIEGHLFKEVMRQGQQPAWWRSALTSLFCDCPHIWLEEHFWHQSAQAATTRYAIIEAESRRVHRYASTMQAYTNQGYTQRFADAGFVDISRYPNMGEESPFFKDKLIVYTAKRV